jgi:hypothetical protein
MNWGLVAGQNWQAEGEREPFWTLWNEKENAWGLVWCGRGMDGGARRDNTNRVRGGGSGGRWKTMPEVGQAGPKAKTC